MGSFRGTHGERAPIGSLGAEPQRDPGAEPLVRGSDPEAESFLSRISVLTRDIDIANLSVCPSVCPSVTFRCQMKTA